MFKKSLLALAMLAAGQSAFAAANADTGNSNLILAASGLNAAGAQVTLAYNTGFFLDDFLPTSTAANTSFSQNLGAAWTTFSGAVANPASIQWTVFAADNTPLGNTTGYRYLGTIDTSGAALQALGNPQAMSNTEFGQIGAPLQGFIGSNNSLLTSDVNVLANTFGGNTNQGGYAVSVSSSSTVLASYSNRNVARLGLATGLVDFDPDAGLGETRNFTMIRRNLTSSSGSQPAQFDDYASFGVPSTFSLTSTGVLNWNVTPIPEPGEWAMMLAGMALIGAITRRRNLSA